MSCICVYSESCVACPSLPEATTQLYGVGILKMLRSNQILFTAYESLKTPSQRYTPPPWAHNTTLSRTQLEAVGSKSKMLRSEQTHFIIYGFNHHVVKQTLHPVHPHLSLTFLGAVGSMTSVMFPVHVLYDMCIE